MVLEELLLPGGVGRSGLTVAVSVGWPRVSLPGTEAVLVV